MSDTSDPFGFGKFVPGFDFLHNLAKNPASMPGMPSWVAPTLDVEEIDKRIEELRAVQFWLDQNATALKATLQALEVQKMTLATLRGMNVRMEDMAEAFRIKTPPVQPFADMSKPMGPFGVPPAPASADATRSEAPPEPPQDDAQAPADEPVPPSRKAKAKPGRARDAAAAPGVVDPLQWWGALTEQFQQIAGDAMKDVARKAGASGPFAHAFAPTGTGQGAAPAAAKAPAKATTRTPTKAKAAGRARPASGAPKRPAGAKSSSRRAR